MKKIITLLFLITVINACETDKILISDSEKVNSLAKSFVENGSQALLFIRLEDKSGKPIYQFSDKNVNLIPNQTINENTWFRIWSMSKIVTISITMDLVEDGLLSLDEPVSKYIPEFKNLKVALTENGSSLTAYAEAMGNDKYKTGNHEATKNVMDCNFYHYSLQLSLYRFLLEEYYGLKVRNQVIAHLKDEEVDAHLAPYMRSEILTMLEYKNDIY